MAILSQFLLQWIPEIRQFCAENKLGNIPIVIVGTLSNKRGPGSSSVSKREGQQLAGRVSAAGYIECGVDQVLLLCENILE